MRLHTSILLICIAFGVLNSFDVEAQKSQYTRKLTENTRLGLSTQKAITQYQCDTWKKNDGLPQNSVLGIIQSSNGFLWLATPEGLARFDGVQFQSYNTTNVPEFKTSSIQAIFEDSRKNLWIGTNKGGLIRLSNGKFKNYTTEKGLPDNTITSIAEDAEGNVWIGTHKGLCKWENEQFKNFSSNDGLSSRDITTLFLGKEGILWVGTVRGLSAYQEGKFEDYGRSRIIFINKYITSIAEDENEQLWIGTQSGLVRFNKKSQEYQTFKIEDGLVDDFITKIYLDLHKTLWIGTQSAGITRIIEKNSQLKKIDFQHFTAKEGLAANSVADLYQDHEGSLWIGLNRGGLNRLRDGKFINYTTLEGLPDNLVNTIYQDQQGDVWIGTATAGLARWRDGKITQIYDKTTGLSNNHIRAIIQDKKGNLWLATYGGGVNVLMLSENQEKPTIKTYTSKDGLAGDLARSLLSDHQGNVWIGTKTGLSKYQNGDFYTFTRRIGLSDNSVICLLQDSKKNIWIGTEGGGLCCIKPDQTILVYRQRNGLANDLVFSIYEDAQNTYWIGTKGGLTRLKDGQMMSIFARDGLLNDDIHSITEDKKGNIWFSSSNGVYSIKKQQLNQLAEAKRNNRNPLPKLTYTLFQEEEGMKSSDCAASAQPSVLKDNKGLLWYPTTEGVSIINPYQIKNNYKLPSVVVKRIVADTLVYVPQGKVIQLPAGTNKIEIDFAALSFLAPTRIQYRYRLLGSSYSEKWIEAGNKRDTYYTNLPPGSYRFEVQASNNDGLWNKKGTEIQFYIAPFFYQTYLFYAFVILSVLALSFLTYYWRIRALEKSKKVLEGIIKKRTHEILSQYEQITQQASELETLNQIVQVINREVQFENVLHALLEQGLRLFSQSNQSLFLLKSPEKDTFSLVATQNYPEDILGNQTFSERQITTYCNRGEKLAEGLYQLPTQLLAKQTFSPAYTPKSSLAMQIILEEKFEGLILFDSADKFQPIQEKDIAKLIRFREHAVSAFEKANILRELEEKNSQIETSFRKISDSIRYARRIQNAILPTEQEIESCFDDFFVFYKPRDIVSGDFYWFAETVPEPIFSEVINTSKGPTSVLSGFDDVKTIIAAVDCTGHGVPGAFMTVIGNDLLNTIVFEHKITRAHAILKRLDSDIKEYLKQEEGQSKDGMDMALLVIDENTHTVEFAGAKNPLYYIREGILHQIKGSIYPIGGAQIKNKEFFSSTLPYQKGDIFYLFSDGVQDQFGGENDRKFGSKRFRELLLSIHHLPMQAQREIIYDTISKWQGSKRQTDDMLVMGVRF